MESIEKEKKYHGKASWKGIGKHRKLLKHRTSQETSKIKAY
jgi:hypothetical protein